MYALKNRPRIVDMRIFLSKKILEKHIINTRLKVKVKLSFIIAELQNPTDGIIIIQINVNLSLQFIFVRIYWKNFQFSKYVNTAKQILIV